MSPLEDCPVCGKPRHRWTDDEAEYADVPREEQAGLAEPPFQWCMGCRLDLIDNNNLVFKEDE